MTKNCNRRLSCLSVRECGFYLELYKCLLLKLFLWLAGKTSKLEHKLNRESSTLLKITLFRSEQIISATSIQRSLKDAIIVQVPELFRILTGSVFLPARFTILWRFSVFTVAVSVTMTTSSQNATACMINETMYFISLSFSWQACRSLLSLSTLREISFRSLSTWENKRKTYLCFMTRAIVCSEGLNGPRNSIQVRAL